jgi:hypothetical protein
MLVQMGQEVLRRDSVIQIAGGRRLGSTPLKRRRHWKRSLRADIETAAAALVGCHQQEQLIAEKNPEIAVSGLVLVEAAAEIRAVAETRDVAQAQAAAET